MMELGGNIQLVGFKDLDSGELVIVKKIVGKYAEQFSKALDRFEKLVVIKKDVHKMEHSQKFEIHGKLLEGGTSHMVEAVENNIFVALDEVLKKLEVIVEKRADRE